eukprot:2862450-Pyramimonas_sp.AAC.1
MQIPMHWDLHWDLMLLHLPTPHPEERPTALETPPKQERPSVMATAPLINKFEERGRRPATFSCVC